MTSSRALASPSTPANRVPRIIVRGTTIPKIVMVAPAMALFVVFYAVPVLVGVTLSLFKWDGLGTPEYVGLRNYRALLLDDRVFWKNVRITLVAAVASVATILPLAMLLAVCLARASWLMQVFRTTLFLPVVMPFAATALLWSEIFNPRKGIANEILGLVGVDPVAWLGDPATALWALVIVTIWSTFGIHVVIQLSALSAIPTDLREAALLETSSGWKIYRHVVLPLLRDAVAVSATLIVTGSFTFFTGVAYIMTRGGPLHSTEVLGLRAYLAGFDELDFGAANAVTVIMMVLSTSLISVILVVSARNRVEY